MSSNNVLINTFHADKWKVNFSNIPSITNFKQLGLYDNFVRSLSIPEYTLEMTTSHFKDEIRRYPTPKKNDNLNMLSIDFKVDENVENYHNLLTYMQAIRYGKVNTETLVRNTINTIEISMLDNQKRTKSKISFTEAFLVSLSALSLVMGSADEHTFTAQFVYEEMLLTKL